MVEIVLGAVVGGLLLVLAAAIVQFNWKRVHIRRAAAKASDGQLESIYRMVEGCGSEKPAGWVLARTNRCAEDTACVISIPDGIEDFPWSGRAIMVEAASEVTVRFTEDTSRAIRCLRKEFKAVAAPRTRSKSGKLRNILSPDRYIALDPALLPALREICPKYPKELLAYLFNCGADSFEFDSISQARIGTSPAWAQPAEFPRCDQCKERMPLILQLPGSIVAVKGWGNGIFYLFGCSKHPEHTKTVVQFT
jgi:hypothetical protein